MLIIHLQHPDEHQFSYAILTGSATSSAWKQGNWGEVSRLAQRENTVLLIPTRDVLLIRASLVTANSRQLKQALPYALEENLIGDPVEQHFVWQPVKDVPNHYDVAVISRATLKRWLAVLKKHKIRARSLLPDVFALPLSARDPAVPVIVRHDGQLLVRTGELSGFSAVADAAPLLIDSLFTETAEERLVSLYSDQQDGWQEGLSVIDSPQPDVLQAESIRLGMGLNLLNGYQDVSMSSFNRNWKRWRVAAVIALLTLGILAGIEAVQTLRLKERLAMEERENLSLFKQVFPEIKNIDVRSMRSRVQSEIRLLEQAVGQDDGARPSPLPYMSTVAKRFQAQKQFTITEIRSRNGQLVIRFDSPSVELLEKLTQDLSQELGFEPEIKSTLSGGGVSAELTLENKS